MNGLRLHHVGCIVPSIEAALPLYLQLHPNAMPSEKYFVSAHGVNVCFVPVGDETFIELIEEAATPSAISTMAKRGVTFYHLGYKADDFDAAVNALVEKGYKAMEAIRSNVYGGKRVQWCLSPVQHWIEVIEA